MSTLTVIFLVGILFLAVASLIALAYAVVHAEEGFEDSTGYHRKAVNNRETTTASSTVDTGNPWDQINGANCPLNLGQSIGHNPVHQP